MDHQRRVTPGCKEAAIGGFFRKGPAQHGFGGTLQKRDTGSATEKVSKVTGIPQAPLEGVRCPVHGWGPRIADVHTMQDASETRGGRSAAAASGKRGLSLASTCAAAFSAVVWLIAYMRPRAPS